jgi:hypothetical protein
MATGRYMANSRQLPQVPSTFTPPALVGYGVRNGNDGLIWTNDPRDRLGAQRCASDWMEDEAVAAIRQKVGGRSHAPQSSS